LKLLISGLAGLWIITVVNQMKTETELDNLNRTFFKLFFLCEDWQSMNRALALKEKLVQNCREQAIIDADFCEYVRLNHPVLRESAIAHVMASDMIIVSARGTEAVPAYVHEWLNEVVALRPGDMVFAEFLGATSREKAAGFHGIMDQWASRCGSCLFSNLFPHSHVPGPVAAVPALQVSPSPTN
jgi:hypothetical protein